MYGASGIGKTVLAGTAPNSLLMTTEPEGAISAKAQGSTANELKVPNWQEWLEYMDWLERGRGYADYEWVCVDSADQLEEHAWNAIMNATGTARSVGGSFRAKSRNDYPLVWSAMLEQVDRLCRLPTNVLITSKVMRIDAENEDEETVTLALPLLGSPKRGDTSMAACGKMTMVGYYRKHRDPETGRVARRLHTEDSERWLAKDRHDTFGRHVSAPNVAEMEKAVAARLAQPGPRQPARKRTATTAKRRR